MGNLRKAGPNILGLGVGGTSVCSLSVADTGVPPASIGSTGMGGWVNHKLGIPRPNPCNEQLLSLRCTRELKSETSPVVSDLSGKKMRDTEGRADYPSIYIGLLRTEKHKTKPAKAKGCFGRSNHLPQRLSE